MIIIINHYHHYYHYYYWFIVVIVIIFCHYCHCCDMFKCTIILWYDYWIRNCRRGWLGAHGVIWLCIRRKFHSALIHGVVKWSLWNVIQGTAVVSCAKFCSGMMSYNGVTQKKTIFHQIWITMENLIVKWLLGDVAKAMHIFPHKGDPIRSLWTVVTSCTKHGQRARPVRINVVPWWSAFAPNSDILTMLKDTCKHRHYQ